MQDRYTGDLGDFSKLGILRVLQMAGLSIGVNWYLTPDENHNNDGCHVKHAFLRKKTFYVQPFFQKNLILRTKQNLKERNCVRPGI